MTIFINKKLTKLIKKLIYFMNNLLNLVIPYSPKTILIRCFTDAKVKKDNFNLICQLIEAVFSELELFYIFHIIDGMC